MPTKTPVKRSTTLKPARRSPKPPQSFSRFINLPKHLNKLIAVLFILIFAGIGSFLVFKSRAANIASIGVYTGPANITGQNNFSTWLGSPVPYGSDYVDHRNTWEIDFNPNWLTEPWGAWVKAAPGRRFALGVPLLHETSRGQFDQCVAGDFDIHFRTLGQNLVSKGLDNTIIRLGYEMNNPSIGPWQATNNPTGYKNCFRRIVGVMRSVSGANFSYDWNTNAGVPGGSTLTKFEDYYPGDDVVDIIGMDQYDIKWQDSSSTPEQRWNFYLSQPMGLNDHKAFATLRNKPMSYPEWGMFARGSILGGGGDSPYYIDRMADWFANNNVAYQSYFNVNWEGSGVMSDFPNGQARYKARFAAMPASDTTPPTAPTNLSSPSRTSDGINLAWSPSTDNVGITAYDIYRNNVKINSVGTTTYSDTGLTASTAYSYYVLAKDAAGNSSPPSATVDATTQASTSTPADTIAPIVTISKPINGSTVGRSTAISATSTDNIAVTKTEVYADGALKATSATGSISYTWNTRRIASGAHTITVKAYDGVGNTGQSSVTVYK